MNGTNWQPIADKVTVGSNVAFRVRGGASDFIMEGTVLSVSQRGLVVQVCASHCGRRSHHSVKWCHVLFVNGVNILTIIRQAERDRAQAKGRPAWHVRLLRWLHLK